jgi:hypothetical protein
LKIPCQKIKIKIPNILNYSLFSFSNYFLWEILFIFKKSSFSTNNIVNIEFVKVSTDLLYVYQPFTFTYLPSSHLLYFLPSHLHELYTLQERSPRWNLMPTQFVFIHNRVIMGFQWMVCWWWLLCFTICEAHSTWNLLFFSKRSWAMNTLPEAKPKTRSHIKA